MGMTEHTEISLADRATLSDAPWSGADETPGTTIAKPLGALITTGSPADTAPTTSRAIRPAITSTSTSTSTSKRTRQTLLDGVRNTGSSVLVADPSTPTHPGRVEWIDSNHGVLSAIANKQLLDKELYLALPARVGNRYPGQRNYHGLSWVSSTGQQVWTESLMERRALLWLDFTSEIVSVASQPMKMFFADGTHHFPDFICLHADQRQVVYNIKPNKFITDKVQRQFDNADRLCAQVGWTHAVVSSFDSSTIRNVEWLANYRAPINQPSEDVREMALSVLDEPLPVGTLASILAQRGAINPFPAIYHLAWSGELRLDLSTPLTNRTLARKASHVHG